MARHSRLEVLSAALEQRVLPIFNAADTTTAIAVVEACAQAGARVVEYTNRGPGAYEVFQALSAHVASERPDVMLGAGTILDGPTAALFIAADADFIVAPTLSARRSPRSATGAACLTCRAVSRPPRCPTPRPWAAS